LASGAFDPFESLDATADIARPSKALWSFDLDDKNNEQSVHKWLTGELNFLKEISTERIRRMKRNLALYRGIQYETQDVRQDRREEGVNRSRAFPKIVVNHLFDLTQNLVSRLVKFKPAVAVLPTSDEFEDKVSAKITDSLLKHIWYIKDFDGDITSEVTKIAKILGEAYLFITWNPDLGDNHPDSPEEGEKIPLLGEDGKQEKDELGNAIFVEKPVKIGDVDYEVVMPWDMYLQKRERFAKVEYCFRRKVMQVEEARRKYPDAADKIKNSKDFEEFDFDTLEARKLVNEVVIWEFYHRRTPAMPRGRMMVFTKDEVLLNTEFPYSHMELPFERFTDIDIPGSVHGWSFFETVKALTSTYNNLTNMVQRNQFMCSHPKWVMPAGSASIKSLGNDITIVQYKGPQPPQLVQASPTPPEVFTFRAALKEEFQQIAGVFGVSRGEPPQGIESGVALQFLNEQESERFNESIKKFNSFIRRTAIKTLAIAGDYYDSTDKRIVRILGKNEQWQTRFFDSAHLSKAYDIRVQNSSALPQSKAARTQTLIDLSDKFPDMFSSAQVLDMLDLAQSDKFINAATQAVRSAEAEDEMILNGDKTAGVKEFEDHLTHWQIHVRTLQSYAFKEATPLRIQKKLKDHILVHEYYLSRKAKFSPKLQEQLGNEALFPIFFVGQAMPETAELEEPQQEGALTQGPLAEAPQIPVNPELGGEPQLPVQEDLPPLDASQPGTPEPPPVAPTSAI